MTAMSRLLGAALLALVSAAGLAVPARADQHTPRDQRVNEVFDAIGKSRDARLAEERAATNLERAEVDLESAQRAVREAEAELKEPAGRLGDAERSVSRLEKDVNQAKENLGTLDPSSRAGRLQRRPWRAPRDSSGRPRPTGRPRRRR
jgi:hypothetical protein